MWQLAPDSSTFPNRSIVLFRYRYTYIIQKHLSKLSGSAEFSRQHEHIKVSHVYQTLVTRKSSIVRQHSQLFLSLATTQCSAATWCCARSHCEWGFKEVSVVLSGFTHPALPRHVWGRACTLRGLLQPGASQLYELDKEKQWGKRKIGENGGPDIRGKLWRWIRGGGTWPPTGSRTKKGVICRRFWSGPGFREGVWQPGFIRAGGK